MHSPSQTAVDASPTRANGVYVNTPAADPSAPAVMYADPGSVLVSRDTMQAVRIQAVPAALKPAAVTLAAWFRVRNTVSNSGSGQGYSDIVSIGDQALIRVYAGQIETSKRVANANWTSVKQSATPGNGVWHHLAASMDGASGLAGIRVGGTGTDRECFGVTIAVDGVPVEALSVSQEGHTSMPAGLTVQGSTTSQRSQPVAAKLSLLPPRSGGRASLQLTEPIPVPEKPMPWRIYRTQVTVAGRVLDQVRIELRHPGDTDDPARYRLVIADALTVAMDGTVAVDGTLWVNGPLVQGKGRSVLSAPGSGVVLDAALRAVLAGTLTVGAAFEGVQIESDVVLAVVSAPAGSRPEQGKPFRYSVTLDNRSARRVSHLEALEGRSVGQSRAEPQPLITELDALPGTVRTFERTINVPPGTAGQSLIVNVVALGVTATGTLAYAAQSHTWTIG